MTEEPVSKPAGVYFGALYFVVAGFLNSTQIFRKWDSPLAFSPLSAHSVWHLAANVAVYLAAAYLLWRLTHWGRLLALVYAYLTVATHAIVFVLFQVGSLQSLPPFFGPLAAFDALALVPLAIYLQPAERKAMFTVSLLEVLLPPD